MAVNRLIDAAIDARNPRTARPRAAGRPAQAQPGRRVRLVALARVRGRGLAAARDHALARADRDRRVRRLSVPQALHAALPPLAGRRATGSRRSARWVAVTGRRSTSPRCCSAAAVALLGRGLRHHLRDDGHRGRPRPGPALDAGRLSAWRARSGSRARCTRSSVVALAGVGLSLSLGPVYVIGVDRGAALLAYEKQLVSPNDLSRVDMAFFSVNGAIALLYFGTVALDVARLVTAPRLELRGVGHAYGGRVVIAGVRLRARAGPGARPAGAERQREVDAAALRRGAAAPARRATC